MRIRIFPKAKNPVDVDALVRVLVDIARQQYRERIAAERQQADEPDDQPEASDD